MEVMLKHRPDIIKCYFEPIQWYASIIKIAPKNAVVLASMILWRRCLMRAAERIGLYVARLRKARGLTDHRDLAKAAGMSPTTVRHVERGGNWTIETLERVAEALSVPVDELLCPKDGENSPHLLELHSALRRYIERGENERELMEDLLRGLLSREEGPEESETPGPDASTRLSK
jgi:transcriptional regulator with XRE-family HTH domain